MNRTVRQMLLKAAETLRSAGVDSPLLDAELMLAKALKVTRTHLLGHPESPVPREPSELFLLWIKRRAAREPLAYILCEKEFYGLTFYVVPSVLIPRPETEFLVDAGLQYLKSQPRPKAADIGTGSGAVAVTLAKYAPHAAIWATDVSSRALTIAKRNAVQLGVAERIHFAEGDLLAPLAGEKFNLIISNPPYIPSGEIPALMPEVSRYEPKSALDGGPDGLNIYHRIITNAPEYLLPGGIIAFEVGQGEGEPVRAMLLAAGFSNVKAAKDYAGIERVVTGEMPE